MGEQIRRLLTSAACSAAGLIAATGLAASAAANPADPVPPAPPPPAPQSAPVVATAGDAPPAEGVPHLASPDALPPGSTMDPSTQGAEGPNVSYLRDLWHAVQNQEISGKEALLLGLAQRSMSTPYPEQAMGPNVPLTPPPPDAPVPPPPPAGGPLLPPPPPAP